MSRDLHVTDLPHETNTPKQSDKCDGACKLKRHIVQMLTLFGYVESFTNRFALEFTHL